MSGVIFAKNENASSAADDGPAALKAPVEDRILSRARGCEFCSLLHASHITCGRFHNHLTLLIDAPCIHADDTRASIRCQNIVSKPFLWMMDNWPGGPDFPAFSFCGALSGPRPGVCSEGEAGATSPREVPIYWAQRKRGARRSDKHRSSTSAKLELSTSAKNGA